MINLFIYIIGDEVVGVYYCKQPLHWACMVMCTNVVYQTCWLYWAIGRLAKVCENEGQTARRENEPVMGEALRFFFFCSFNLFSSSSFSCSFLSFYSAAFGTEQWCWLSRLFLLRREGCIPSMVAKSMVGHWKNGRNEPKVAVEQRRLRKRIFIYTYMCVCKRVQRKDRRSQRT